MPDNYETLKATEVLAKEGFIVMPYMLPDLNIAKQLTDAGAANYATRSTNWNQQRPVQ